MDQPLQNPQAADLQLFHKLTKPMDPCAKRVTTLDSGMRQPWCLTACVSIILGREYLALWSEIILSCMISAVRTIRTRIRPAECSCFLELFSIGDRSAFRRVRQQVLSRYVHDDRGLLYGSVRPTVPDEVARKLFDSGDAFLAVMDDNTSRKHLETLRAENIPTSPVWKEVREMSKGFNE